MKEALFYKVLKDNKVQCELCPHKCTIPEEKSGFCKVRQNIKGKLFSLVYGKSIATSIDPIEKKPLYHFLPGSFSMSVATVGCNLKCEHCQNWEISQPREIIGENIEPKEIVKLALENECKSISYTYTEPTIFYEYMIETAKLAKKAGIKNVIVSNGYINEKPLKKLLLYIDAANIDLKSFNPDFYKDVCKAKLEPVLNTIKLIASSPALLEITNLIIPEKNDNLDEIKDMCNWIIENIGNNAPLHFSAFYPQHKMLSTNPTPPDTLFKAYEIAKKTGINYIYLGNIQSDKGSNTLCPKCNSVLIERSMMNTENIQIKDNKCNCGEKIPGLWE